MRSGLLAPVVIRQFYEDLFEIESKVYPVRKTLVRKAQVRMVIAKVTGVVEEFELFFDGSSPVFVNVKRGADSAPELKVSIDRSKTTSVVICKKY